MNSLSIDLFQARDAEDSHAVALSDDAEGELRKQSGFGAEFEKVWTVEFQTPDAVDGASIDWDLVLERAIEAYQMSDPVITGVSLTQPNSPTESV